MAITITNIAALRAQRHVSAAGATIAQAMTRIASGKRINSAKDDPAGYAIANRMTSQINGMGQAISNARDGISLAQVAEGGLGTMEDMLQRIRVLAVQASNATNSSADRQALQEEVSQLLAEINRTAETLNFNGRKILDGSSSVMTFQVGANAGDTINIPGTNMLTKNYGLYQIRQNSGSIGSASNVTGGDITLSGNYGKAIYTARAGASAREIASGINTLTEKTGISASAKTDINISIATGASVSLLLTADNGSPIGFTLTAGTTGNPADDLAAAVNAINAQTGRTGVTAEVDTKNGGIRLTHAKGSDITLENTDDSTAVSIASYSTDGKPGTATTLAAGDSSVASGTITYSSAYGFFVNDQSGLNSTGGTSAIASLHAVSTIDISNFDGAQHALNIIDAALNVVIREQSRYGALQRRFGYTIENLQMSAENLSTARSRIEDADYAAETARLAQAAILQQAAVAMLAQANRMHGSFILQLLESVRRK